MPISDPTRLGTVEDVSGASVRIKLADGTETGLIFVEGEGYRVGQVGSFVRIPVGYTDLFGIVSKVGAGAAPETEEGQSFGNRWLLIELIGEGDANGKFERGISQYPTVGDIAHVVTEANLAKIYAPGNRDAFLSVGRVASAESVLAYLDLNKLVTRHSAILGSTGSGKSTTVASVLNSLSSDDFPNSRIILLDLHGEYSNSFGNKAKIFAVNPDISKGENALHVPFWALTVEELATLTTGPLTGPGLSHFVDSIAEMKRSARPSGRVPTVPQEEVTADTPLPFSIHNLWYELHSTQNATHYANTNENQSRSTWALEEDENGQEMAGDALTIRRPLFRQHKNVSGDDEKIYKSNSAIGLKQQTAALEGRLRDPRLNFLFRPGPWSVTEEGETEQDLDTLLQSWVGDDKPITVLDLSGIPPAILDALVGAVLRILFDSLFWGRETNAGAKNRPLLIALEEAHSYLSSESKGNASLAARRIAKEGRKYGIGLMLVSQRPSEIDPTILSQCGTFVAMRLSNDRDRNQVKSCSADNLEGLFSMLPILRTGEALVVGEAVGLPVRVLIDQPPPGRRPNSSDPLIVPPLDEAVEDSFSSGWKAPHEDENYATLVNCWRTHLLNPPENSE